MLSLLYFLPALLVFFLDPVLFSPLLLFLFFAIPSYLLFEYSHDYSNL
jgi:hypothetical protein